MMMMLTYQTPQMRPTKWAHRTGTEPCHTSQPGHAPNGTELWGSCLPQHIPQVPRYYCTLRPSGLAPLSFVLTDDDLAGASRAIFSSGLPNLACAGRQRQ